MYMHNDLFCCTSEIKTTLYVNYSPIKKKKKILTLRSSLGNQTPVLTLEDLAIKFGELFFHNEREIQIIE